MERSNIQSDAISKFLFSLFLSHITYDCKTRKTKICFFALGKRCFCRLFYICSITPQLVDNNDHGGEKANITFQTKRETNIDKNS
jgi:hypothetical protein